MPILIVLTDLRSEPFRLACYMFPYQPGMTAFNLVNQAVGNHEALEIHNALEKNDPKLIVSWYNVKTDDISEIGGVGSLLWPIDNYSILTINYEDQPITEIHEMEIIKWTLENTEDFVSGFSPK